MRYLNSELYARLTDNSNAACIVETQSMTARIFINDEALRENIWMLIFSIGHEVGHYLLWRCGYMPWKVSQLTSEFFADAYGLIMLRVLEAPMVVVEDIFEYLIWLDLKNGVPPEISTEFYPSGDARYEYAVKWYRAINILKPSDGLQMFYQRLESQELSPKEKMAAAWTQYKKRSEKTEKSS